MKVIIWHSRAHELARNANLQCQLSKTFIGGAVCREFELEAPINSDKQLTRSSDVAVIGDHTAYDVQYTGKLSDQFWFWYARSDSTGRVYERAWTLSTQLTQVWPLAWQTSSPRLQWISERNTTSARLIVWLKKLTFAFSLIRFMYVCG